MKSDFLLAITQLSAEKNLPKDVVLTAVESALASAYKKEDFAANQNITVKINPNTGKVEVYAEKIVAEKPADIGLEITLAEAKKIKSDAKIGDAIMVESTPANAGRIAAQTAKQVILQRLHEAEHSAIFEEYADKEGEVVSGIVQRFEAGQVNIDLGRTEAILPPSEQVRTERYRIGQRLKVRSHPELLRRLFELEVPEVYNGTVEIKSIAREAGFRSKIAVTAKQEGIDPVGCCVGLRGIRIQNIVSELSGEKIDVVQWNADQASFIASALSPAHILSVELNKAEQAATVIVPDKQLSLAIGKEGQNARLAAKLTGYRIDIKSASMAEAEKPAVPKATAKEQAPAEAVEAELASEEIPADILAEPVAVAAAKPVVEEETTAEDEAEAAPAAEELIIAPPVVLEPQEAGAKVKLRFAEDIMAPRRAKVEPKTKKKKKGAHTRDAGDDTVKVRGKGRRDYETVGEDEEDQ
jgi:N utilization substance protein A